MSELLQEINKISDYDFLMKDEYFSVHKSFLERTDIPMVVKDNFILSFISIKTAMK